MLLRFTERKKREQRKEETFIVCVVLSRFSYGILTKKKFYRIQYMWAGEIYIVGDRKIDRSSACPAFKHMGFFFLNVAQGIESTHTHTFTFTNVQLYWSLFHSNASCLLHINATKNTTKNISFSFHYRPDNFALKTSHSTTLHLSKLRANFFFSSQKFFVNLQKKR